MEIRIISHPLCPHAQRLRLALHKKGLEDGVDFMTQHIDLADVPSWFSQLSPAGRMPAVLIDERPALHRSASVLELFEETLPSRLMPAPGFQRVRVRDFMATSDLLLDELKRVFTAQEREALEVATAALFDRLAGMERDLGSTDDGPWLCMADIAMAPFFSLALFDPWLSERPEWTTVPRLRAWGQRLLADDAVLTSRCDDYGGQFAHFFRTVSSVLSSPQAEG